MSGKVVVITGASGGIGAELARQLAMRGARLVLGARREEELRRVAQECGSGTLPIRVDVTRRQDVERLRDESLRAFGGVDVWVNNAGRGIGRPVLAPTDAAFDEMMAINAKSALYGMQAILPHFEERGEGHLINVSSTLGRIPFATYRSAYSAAKAALNTLTANLRMDLGREYPNIHISLVMPPTVSSDFARNALHGTPEPPGGRRAGIVIQTPSEAAAAIVGLIDHPQQELYTDPGAAETVARYYADVAGFEEEMRRWAAASWGRDAGSRS